mmetsp:Transcript_42221/g.40447  ORF Transcript_42221/g.40447 Transcript_42221/m.40447 type:complete len:136 (+) Transcript_42221:241-648(+)
MGEGGTNDGNMRVYYKKLVIYLMLPVALTFFGLVYWLIVSAIKRSLYSLRSQLISTVVVLLFLIHPTINNMMFSAFNCMDVVGISRLIPDITEECFTGDHLVYAFGVAFMGVLIWAIGIPLFALVLLLKNKKIII